MDVQFFSVTTTNDRIRCELNRPNRLNAIDLAVMDELEKIVQFVEQSKVNVFEFGTSEAGFFASGGDLKAFSQLISEQDGHRMASKMASILQRIEQLPCITIASVCGKAFGGGCELALAFDLIFATSNSMFGFTQAKFGLPPGWNGSARLVSRLGYNKALFLLSGQQLVNAQKAVEMGLIDEVFDSSHHLNQHIDGLLKTPKEVLFAIKESVSLYRHIAPKELKEKELRVFAKAWGSEVHHNLVADFFATKRINRE